MAECTDCREKRGWLRYDDNKVPNPGTWLQLVKATATNRNDSEVGGGRTVEKTASA